MSKVKNITQDQEENWGDFVSKNAPMVIQASASWCGPCKKISLVFKQMAADEKSSLKYYYLDIDVCKDAASELEITSVPMFLYYGGKDRNGNPSKFSGADEKGLKLWLAGRKK